MLPLRAAINKAKKQNKSARRENVRVHQNGGTRAVDVEVVPPKNLRERCYPILFEDAEKAARASYAPIHEQPDGPTQRSRSGRAKEDARRALELARELAEMRDYLQSVMEQQEATSEELHASSEEIQSTNEELQSVNEELETSKEELEAANEELMTVNEEMVNRNMELNGLNSDLINLQNSSNLAIGLLGSNLTIRRFSPQAQKHFNLMATDIGRTIDGFRHNFDVTGLGGLVRTVIDSIRENEQEVQDRDGRWYSLRIRPYHTLDNKVDVRGKLGRGRNSRYPDANA
jgi:two-component system CheB/CheR fusion protein